MKYESPKLSPLTSDNFAEGKCFNGIGYYSNVCNVGSNYRGVDERLVESWGCETGQFPNTMHCNNGGGGYKN